MRRKLLVALGVAVAGLMAAAAAQALTKTTLSISVTDLGDGQLRASGYVRSDQTRCHRNRLVYLYRAKGRIFRPTRDKLLGRRKATTPNGDGTQWFITFKGAPTVKVYAYVKKTRYCTGAYSARAAAAPEG